MSQKRFNSDQIIGLSREADVKVSQGKNVGQVLLIISRRNFISPSVHACLVVEFSKRVRRVTTFPIEMM